MSFEAFFREDGLWDIDAHMTDVRAIDSHLLTGIRPAGTPMHEMWLRVTIDLKFNILEAIGTIDYAPHPDICPSVAPDYSQLVGMNLMRDFRGAVRARFGKTARCTHLNELAGQLPTAAVQALYKVSNQADATVRPFPIDQCHAQRSDGEVVRILYPNWHRPAQSGTEAVPVSAAVQNYNKETL